MCDRPAAIGKDELGSRMLAENMVTLHKLSAPTCRTFGAYPCGDHFHTGHSSRAAGDACKAAHPFHRPHQPGRRP